MATFRLSAKVVKRSNGHSATAAAAYRAGEELRDERLGQTWDYTNKSGVLYSEILAPHNAPDWMLDRSQLWNAVERVEKRRDAQLAREIQLSLPHELTRDQRIELVREFVRDEFVSQGMIADLSVHMPDRGGDPRNHHAHVMLTMRNLAGAGFGNKNRDWNDTEQLEAWRADWAQAVNLALEKHGHQARVDHRSYADRGIDREPEPKQGPVATEMEREGRQSHAGDDRRAAQARNAEREALALAAEALQREAEALQLQRAAEERWRQAEEKMRSEGEARAREDDTADAQKRYARAYRKHYDAGDPYASLATIAAAEHELFRQEQDELARQVARELDPEKRRSLELRKEIEGCDYMVITSERIAAQSEVISGRADSGDAVGQREKARIYRERAAQLREERALTPEERRRRLQAELDQHLKAPRIGPPEKRDRGPDLER